MFAGTVSGQDATVSGFLAGVRVAAGTLLKRMSWVGNGWTLTLPPGWVIAAGDGGSLIVTPPAGATS